ncbi:MAG: Trm112 family protein [Anaerolineae bacterium]
MAVSTDLLDILRCPHCVSGDTRKPGDDPGQLTLVKDGTWLVCQEADCGRKYPIKEDIPVMLIEDGTRWMNTPVDELPAPGKLVE